MKRILLITALAISPVFSDEKDHKHDHGHDHGDHAKVINAPNGGRILKQVEPHAEFFITKDRKVQITFLNDAGKAVENGATLKAVGGKLAAPTKFTFVKTKHGLLSEQKLPEGMMVPMMLMFKDAEGKAAPRIKFNVDMSKCPTCDFLEYGCTCDHSGDHKGHDHGDHKGHDHGKK